MIKIFNDYYKFEQLAESQTRFDATASTESYECLETILLNKRGYNNGGLSFHYTNCQEYIKCKQGRKADKSISKTKHLSSIFIPDLNGHLIGYGDIRGTLDALILLFNPTYTTIEIFIARGYVNDIHALYAQVKEGEFQQEFETLRKTAKGVFKGELPKR